MRTPMPTGRGAADGIRVALIGYGLAGAVFHAPLIAACPGMRLEVVVTANPERQAQARQRHPDARVLDSIETLWRDAGSCDLVVVATPNRHHVAIAMAALEAGLPTVVDKPLAPTTAEARNVVAAFERRNLLLTVFHNRRWDGDMLTIRQLLDKGVLGPVVRFESRFERWQPAVHPQAWRQSADPEDAGGLLFDLGSHIVDQALALFGRPSRIYAEIERRRPGTMVDDDVFLALEHEGGVRAHLWTSAVTALPGPRFRVIGRKGAYVKQELDIQEAQLRAGLLPRDAGFGVEPPSSWGQLAIGDEVHPLATEAGAWPRFYAEVREALRSGAPAPVDPHEAVVVIEVLEAARASAREGSIVAFPASAP